MLLLIFEPNLSSALIFFSAGILSMIDDPNQELKTFALKRLDSIVDQFWPEIADEIEKLEALYEDPNFSNRELAALVISKVYFHLGVYDVALNYALGAGLMFDVEIKSEYVNTIIGKHIFVVGLNAVTLLHQKLFSRFRKMH